MSPESMPIVIVFVMAGSLAAIVGLLVTGKKGKVDRRIDAMVHGNRATDTKPESVGGMARLALPKMGKVIVPEDEAERTKLRARLVHAGFYQKQAMHAFLGVKLALLMLATIVGVGLTLAQVLPTSKALPMSLGLFVVGMLGPSFWLNKQKAARQSSLRRGLPDALDVLIICLEGGLSLQAGLKKVADELRSAHPVLGGELRIVDREIGLGRSPGDALNNLARRSDMEEILSLASVIGQSEKFGASLVKSLRNHSETLRHKRKQKAEERAHKAATKMLIPTLLFIFPAVFVILLAPAAIQVTAAFKAQDVEAEKK